MDSAALKSAQEQPWFYQVNLESLVRVGRRTILHPFVMWMIPLCLRAQLTPYSHPSFIISVAYATFITIAWIAWSIDQRVAYGLAREVDLAEEVIVITGGSSGLGQLIAEVYGMRGAAVAVLDVEPMEGSEAKGVQFYECDVGDSQQVEQVAKKIEKEVGRTLLLRSRIVFSVHG